MLVHEFRSNMKKHLDDAVRGVPVVIERGGMEFYIIASPKGTGIVTVGTNVASGKTPLKATLSPDLAKPIKTAQDAADVAANLAMDSKKIGTGVVTRRCKNLHPIPEGRSKCLGKGCKYAK